MKEKITNIDVKDEIFKEAVKLFLQKGYQGTSIQDITDAVNISKGAFYWHFKSKTKLLETIIEEFDKVFLDSLIATVEGTEGDFTKKFKVSHKYASEFAYNNRDLCVGFVTLSAEFAGSGTEIDEKLKTVSVKFVRYFRRLLEIGKQEGRIRPDIDPKVTAHVIMDLHHGSLLVWYMNVEGVDGKSLAKAFRDIALWGILRQEDKE